MTSEWIQYFFHHDFIPLLLISAFIIFAILRNVKHSHFKDTIISRIYKEFIYLENRKSKHNSINPTFLNELPPTTPLC